MHDEVSHFGIVDGTLRLRLPGRIGARIVRIDTDDVESVEVAELQAGYAVQLAAENQMEQLLCWLLRGVRHEIRSAQDGIMKTRGVHPQKVQQKPRTCPVRPRAVSHAAARDDYR